jgi:FixJ family two-component response regulator
MILIIDDDIAVRTSLLLLFKSEGYEAEGTPLPSEALIIIKKKSPELILLDLNFSIDTSGKEGMDLLERIKKIGPAIPIILITGWGSIELAVKGMKLGANDFINKPWSNEHLLQ